MYQSRDESFCELFVFFLYVNSVLKTILCIHEEYIIYLYIDPVAMVTGIYSLFLNFVDRS